ncbi:MAG: hypothetical protein ACOYUZ_06455 [Patescibacteria group bacterium]
MYEYIPYIIELIKRWVVALTEYEKSEKLFPEEMVMKENKEKHRVQLDFGTSIIQKIEWAKNRLGLATKRDVFLRALNLLFLVIERLDKGEQIAFVDKDGNTEKVHFIF